MAVTSAVLLRAVREDAQVGAEALDADLEGGAVALEKMLQKGFPIRFASPWPVAQVSRHESQDQNHADERDHSGDHRNRIEEMQG